jgi:CRP/FNR family transcriptional regulator, cyclic AMP receptor protein
VETSSAAPDPARIQSLPLFSSLSLDECAALAGRSQERDYDTGRHLMQQGAGGYTFSVIESGTADVLVDDTLVRSVGPGDVLGEFAIKGDGHRTASVVATSPVHLFAFFGLDLHDLERDHPELAGTIQQLMDERR